MKPMVQKAIEALLAEKIGLDPTSIGSQKISRAIETRRLACGLADGNLYLNKLQTSPQEWEELIEELVIPETWFYRDRKPFEFLSEYVTSQILPKQNKSVIRLLSAPCSTGEEPYSIAMCLINAGLLPKQFCIDAVDISKKALAKAKQGIYGKNSFRGGEIPEKARFFQEKPDGWELQSWVRQTVNLVHGNLLDPYLSIGKSYDVIFCRNLLIYLSESAYSQTIDLLARLLLPDGLLFVGSSEMGKPKTDRLVSVRQPFTFAYRKTEELANDRPTSRLAKTSLNYQKPQISTTANESEINPPKQPFKVMPEMFPTKENWGTIDRRTLYPLQNVKGTLTDSKKSSSFNPENQSKNNDLPIPNHKLSSLENLETARKLADGGNLNEATSLVKNYLLSHPTSHQAYLLLGEVYQANGDEKQAEECFQKSLYLEPNCYEALTHLALIKKNRGDFKSAAVIEQRIQRLENKGSNL